MGRKFRQILTERVAGQMFTYPPPNDRLTFSLQRNYCLLNA